MLISVVIPALNEERGIAETIARTRAAGSCEIIVVDGGSTDRTVHLAAGADRVMESPAGRGRQQNAGARQAAGEVLLFLHADCRPEPGVFDAIESALKDPRCIGGCLRQRIDSPGLGFRLLEIGNALRVKTLGWAYGDQGIFLRRSLFEDVGGFPDVPLMEDLLLMKRIKGRGVFSPLAHRLHVDARRWSRRGIIRQTLQNWRLLGLAHLGVPPARLAQSYRNIR